MKYTCTTSIATLTNHSQ